jgi:hypothetical protein
MCSESGRDWLGNPPGYSGRVCQIAAWEIPSLPLLNLRGWARFLLFHSVKTEFGTLCKQVHTNVFLFRMMFQAFCSVDTGHPYRIGPLYMPGANLLCTKNGGRGIN